MAGRLRHNRRRARRALLWGSAIFCAAQLAAGILLDYAWPLVRFPNLSQTLAALRALPRSPDVLCLGSSRMGTAFREQLVQAEIRQASGDDTFVAFNAAIDGADLATADLVMERILQQGARPRAVLLEVSPETLAQRNDWLVSEAERQWTWTDMVSRIGELCCSRGSGRLCWARLLPLVHYRQDIRREIGDRLVELFTPSRAEAAAEAAPTSGLSWESYMSRQREIPSAPAIRSRSGLRMFRKWLVDYRVGGKSVQALERLMGRCRKNGVAVVLVAPPLTSEHCQLYTPAIEAAFLDYVRSTAERNGCQFADYRRQLPDSAFQDNHHVMSEGGEKFSRQFAHEILTPVWLARWPEREPNDGSPRVAREPHETPQPTR